MYTPIEPPPQDWLSRDVRRALRQARKREGLALPGDPPRLFFQCSGRPTTPLFTAHVMTEVFGGVIVVSAIDRPMGGSQVLVYQESPTFRALRAGQFEAALIHGGRVAAAFNVTLDSDGFAVLEGQGQSLEGLRAHIDRTEDQSFINDWTAVDNYEPPYPHQGARYWWVLGTTSCLTESAEPDEHLSIGWAHRLAKAVRSAEIALTVANGFRGPLPDLDRPLAAFMRLVNATDVSLVSLLDHVRALHENGLKALFGLLDSGIGMTGDHAIAYQDLLGRALDAHFASPDITQEGSRVPWISPSSGEIRYLSLTPDRFPPGIEASEFWRRLPDLFPMNLGEFVSGGAMPIDLTPESPHWPSFPTSNSVEEDRQAAIALIEEGRSEKRWSIPRGACFELSVGPFSHFTAHEQTREVWFVATNRRGEYAQIALDLDNCELAIPLVDAHSPVYDDTIRARLQLLLAALIRDFWVVEKRERVFGQRRRPVTRKSPRSNEPAIVYLPRVRYADTPNVRRCSTTLALAPRRTHRVSAHLRKARHVINDN